MYWLPKLHKRPNNANFIANSSSFTTVQIINFLPHCGKSRVIRYYETVYEMSKKNMVWSTKTFGEVLSNLQSRGFRATSLSIYDFPTHIYVLYHITP